MIQICMRLIILYVITFISRIILIDSCYDSVPNCPGWKQYCTEHTNLQAICPKTCNVCSDPGKLHSLLILYEIL